MSACRTGSVVVLDAIEDISLDKPEGASAIVCIRRYPPLSTGGLLQFTTKSPLPGTSYASSFSRFFNGRAGTPPLAGARGRVPRPADDRARHDHRERGPAGHPAGSPLHPGQPHLGRRRLPRDLRQLPAARRSPRRSVRPQAHVPRRRGDLHRRLGAVRPGARPGRADRRALHPGHRRRRPGLGDPRDHRHRVPARPATGPAR